MTILPAFDKPPSLKPSKLGGLNHLERLLGLRQDAVLSTDAVFVSLDLEVDSDRLDMPTSPENTLTRQLAFARLDTRDLRSLSSQGNVRKLVSVSMFHCRKMKTKKDRRHCFFGRTQHINQDDVPATIKQNLAIRDDTAPPSSSQLRNIVLVGHSLRHDLKVLRFLGINLMECAPILTIIDTHTISRFIFPPYHPSLLPEPHQNFSLAGVLAQLGYEPPHSGFHNAGNDAVYTLYAMLLLAIKRARSRIDGLREDELEKLELLSDAVSNALGQGQSAKNEETAETEEITGTADTLETAETVETAETCLVQ